MSAGSLSYPVSVDSIPPDGRHIRIEASETERRNIAESLGIPEVTTLSADLRVSRGAGGAIHVSGTVEANVVQADVVTLNPVSQIVSEPVDLTLLPAESLKKARRRAPVAADPTDVEGPEYYQNGRIDLGAIVTEHLALGLDPYPRAPDTEFSGHIEDKGGDRDSPFAALARLKPREEK